MDRQVLSACRAAVQELRVAAREARSWSPPERRAVLAEVERLTAVLVGARADVLAAEEAAGTWRAPGVPSLGARLGRDTGVGRGAGAARVRQADAWGQVPVLARAAEDGVITTAHVDAVGRATRAAEPAVLEAFTSPDGQHRLVELATRLDAPTFAKEVARAVARLDPAGVERDHERQRRARHLHLVDAADGTRVTGLLDHQDGRRLRLALEAVTPRPTDDDERTAPQRAADALVTLADTVLSSPDTGSGAAVRPHVSLVMSVETLAELRAAQAGRAEAVEVDDADEAAGADPGCRARGRVRSLRFGGSVDPVTDEDGRVTPFSEVARILCDCTLTRVVLDAAGEPVDLGRAHRLYTGAQRRAVLARDRGCAWAGCATPARWCEIHHIAWWNRDAGPTSIENGVTLCRFHHHEVHRLDLVLERGPADLPLAIGRAGEGPGDAATSGLDPGRPTVAYTIRTRDGTVVTGGAPVAGSGGTPAGGQVGTPISGRGGAPAGGQGGAMPARGSPSLGTQERLPIGA